MKVKVNDTELDLPPGTSAIDAVFAAGYDVPLFCSQEFMSPIGACRMCLARVGAPRKDRDTGDWIRDEATGEVKIFYFPNLMATCTTAIMEGMVIDTLSKDVKDAQNGMVEFTLINHPLDCPVCDKGGACELQDRAYEYGTGISRFQFDKRHQEKHHALSPLITLDRERCIHCKRCVRYFEEIPGDEVLDFIERGGHTYIGTMEGGLPSNFTGNITDMCPVGALLDATSRFRGRNWEYDHTPSTCLDCPVGCSTVIDARTGRIERIKADRNPWVNNDWLCDGGRFGHEYADAEGRFTTPLVRKGGTLEPATWEEAAAVIRERLAALDPKAIGIALRADVTLEEGVAAKALAEQLGTGQLDHAPRPSASVIPQGSQATLRDVATSDGILVVGDLTEEAPIVDLRIKDALKGIDPPELLPHGVPIADLRLKERMPREREILTVAAPYRVDLMRHAGSSLRYVAGKEAALLRALTALAQHEESGGEIDVAGLGVSREALEKLVARLQQAKKPVLIVGALVTASSEALQAAQRAAGALGAKLMIVGPMANSYGLELTGILPSHARYSYASMLKGSAKALVLSGLNPAQDPRVAERLKGLELLVVHAAFPNETTELAHVVLPAKTGYEKEGTTVNLEGRALRVRAAPVESGLSEDFTGVVRHLGEALGVRLDGRSVRSAQRALRKALGFDPQDLLEAGGLVKARSKSVRALLRESEAAPEGNALLVPTMVRIEELGRNPHLRQALGEAVLELHPEDAAARELQSGDAVTVEIAGVPRRLVVKVSERPPAGLCLLPRSADQSAGLRQLDWSTLRKERIELEVAAS